MGVAVGVVGAVGAGVIVDVGICVKVGVVVGVGTDDEQEDRMETRKRERTMSEEAVLFCMGCILPLVAKINIFLMGFTSKEHNSGFIFNSARCNKKRNNAREFYPRANLRSHGLGERRSKTFVRKCVAYTDFIRFHKNASRKKAVAVSTMVEPETIFK